MPGKYSHSLVLAQYSSEGLISLPNGPQLGYFKDSRPITSTSARKHRTRFASNATGTSTQTSLETRSIKSNSQNASAANLALSVQTVPDPQPRLVITASDSEDESGTAETRRAVNSFHSQSEHNIARPKSTSRAPQRRKDAQMHHGKVSRNNNEIQGDLPASSASGVEASQTPAKQQARKSGFGVKAFIQARYNAEVTASYSSEKIRATGPTTNTGDDKAMTIHDFIKAEMPQGRPSNQQPPAEHREKDLSLREFITSMPHPDTLPQTAATSEKDPSLTSSVIAHSLGWTSSIKHGNVNGLHGDFMHNDGNQREEYSSTVQITRPTTELNNGSEVVSKQRARAGDKTQAITRPSTVRRTDTSIYALEEDNDSARSFGKDRRTATVTPSSANVPDPTRSTMQSHSGSRSRGTLHTPSHMQAVNADSSDDSSTHGLASVGQMTTTPMSQLSSRLSSKPKTDPIQVRAHPEVKSIVTIGASTDSFGQEFQDDHYTTTIFTSDEEEIGDDSREMRRPNYQSNDLVMPTRHWGMISAGKDYNPCKREADEMSEISAVFPPDIGRYKYGGDAGGPLAIAMGGIMEEPGTSRTSSGAQSNKLRKSRTNSGGLLGRLRMMKSGRR